MKSDRKVAQKLKWEFAAEMLAPPLHSPESRENYHFSPHLPSSEDSQGA